MLRKNEGCRLDRPDQGCRQRIDLFLSLASSVTLEGGGSESNEAEGEDLLQRQLSMAKT